MSSRRSKNKNDEALAIFRASGGTLRTGEALNLGIHRRTLYGLRDSGHLERLDRGLYRLADMPPLTAPDLSIVAHKVPDGVICLISALHFHGITTQIPHVVSVAVKRGKELPRLAFPPTKFFFYSDNVLSEGVAIHSIDDVKVRVFSPEKTLADCFKYRNKIGMDTVKEALKMYVEQGKSKPRDLLTFGKICRVEKIMQPYLEALL